MTFRLEQPLAYRSGTRPAGEIKKGDTVQLEFHPEPLYVFGLTRDPDGYRAVTLGEEDQGERLELELTLLRLEAGA